jgi:hypothetical protein
MHLEVHEVVQGAVHVSVRPKTFSVEYSAETNIRLVLPKTKKVLFSNLELANATRENFCFPYANLTFFGMFTALCRIFVIGRIFGSIFLPNICFRPKQENPFSVDH